MLSRNFKKDEFICGCGCGGFIECPELVKKLQRVRDRIGVSITVNSGTRCVLHNLAVGGSADSSHVKGMAADISCRDMKVLLQVALRVFRRVGISGSYIHVDVDPAKPQDIYWVYVE